MKHIGYFTIRPPHLTTSRKRPIDILVWKVAIWKNCLFSVWVGVLGLGKEEVAKWEEEEVLGFLHNYARREVIGET